MDIWSCAPCESSSEALDNKIKEVNAKVDEVKKDVKEIGDRQDSADLREQVRDTRVDKQDTEIAALRERLARLEADSGNHILGEIDDRKLREQNVIIHGIPELQNDSIQAKKEADQATLQYLLDTLGLNINVSTDVKFCRRRGKVEEGDNQGDPRPLLVGFRYQRDQETVLANSWRLSKVKDKATRDVNIVRDLTDRERKRERDLVLDVKNKNLQRSDDEQSKNLVYKVVGERGRRREIQVTLRQGEFINREGLVEVVRSAGTGSNLIPLGNGREGLRPARETVRAAHVMDQEPVAVLGNLHVEGSGAREKVADLVKALEAGVGGAKQSMTSLVKEGRWSKLGTVLLDSSKDNKVENSYQWEEVEANGRGFKNKRKSLSCSPPVLKKKARSQLESRNREGEGSLVSQEKNNMLEGARGLVKNLLLGQ